MAGIARFTWGNSTLLSGIEMIPVCHDWSFAVTEVLKTVKPGKLTRKDATGSGEPASKMKTVLLA